MAKLSIITLLSSFFIVASLLPLAYSQPKVTTVRLFLHDQFNRTDMKYGDVFGFQDPLRVGPEPDSTQLGWCQGTIAFTTHDASSDLHVSLAYIFISGMYADSTVVAAGRNDVTQSFRQFPIVGGTGAFALARGIVNGSTYSTEPPIFIYDLEIIQDLALPRIEMKADV